jgi:threonine dehydratase
MGIEVVIAAGDTEAVTAMAHGIAEKRGLTLIDTQHDDMVLCGYGTLALEVCASMAPQPPDLVLCAARSGILLAVVAMVFKAVFPNTRVIGVQSEHDSALYHFFKGRNRGNGGHLPAQSPLGLENELARKPEPLAKQMLPRLVDDLRLVSDESISRALLYLLEHHKMVTDMNGTMPVAALADDQLDLRVTGQRVVAIITGGNFDLNLLSRIVERGLLKSGRLTRMNVLLSDRPGALERLAHLFASHRANILQVHHDRLVSQTPFGAARCDLTVETRGPDHVQQLIQALEGEGYSFTVTQ